tara:strand:+ start:535 stop:1239 length:705 start_codon:yes stop_codon:yes gene_type:complete
MSHSLSVVIITKNEENFIEDAISSANFADEVLVLDSISTDKTCELSLKMGARVLSHEWLGFGKQKNLAVRLATHDWVFVLDADERITPNLKIELLSTLKDPSADGYLVPRLNSFFGKEIKTCGLYPDYSLRLYKKSKGMFSDVDVHESVKLDGKVTKLKNHMIHLAYDNVDEFIEKQKMYSNLSHKNKNIFKAIIGPFWTFFKIYIIKRGFLDGWHGYIIAKVYAKYTFWKYIK